MPLNSGGIMTETAKSKYGSRYPVYELSDDALQLQKSNIERYIYRNLTVIFLFFCLK